MTDYKYPFIPKDYYKATMFACKMIRENGYFNKAIKTASRYYGVDEDEVRKHVVARTKAGKKAKKKPARKFKWYVVHREYGSDCVIREQVGSIFVARGASHENVQHRMYEEDHNYCYMNDTGSDYSSLIRITNVIDTPYDTKAEAEAAAEKYKKELEAKYGA